MTQKSRYFLIASAVVLIVGLGGGLVAYLMYQRGSGIAGVPSEMRYVPDNAALVAYIDVRRVMNSELHREMMPTIEQGSRKGRQMMNDFAGIDIEKQVDHVVVYVEPSDPADKAADAPPRPPNALMLVQGTFDQARIEQFIRDKGGVIETYNGHHFSVHKKGEEEMAVGFVRSDLLAVGQTNLVRRALDAPGKTKDLTSNVEVMGLIRDASGSSAWVVGYFDAVSLGMRLPSSVSDKVPPLRLVSAKADVNGGVRATIRAETATEGAAEQLREVVRGFVALARMQGGVQPAFGSTLKSIELSGRDKTVQMSFEVSLDTLRALAAMPRPNREPGTPNPGP